MLQVDLKLAAGYLCSLFEHIRENMKVPEDWKKAMIVKVPKKGDLSKYDNFREISLLSVPTKVLSRVVIERIKEGIDAKLRCEQAGFQKGRGTIEHTRVYPQKQQNSPSSGKSHFTSTLWILQRH